MNIRFFLFFSAVIFAFSSYSSWATHPSPLPDVQTTPNEGYNVRYTDNNPYDPNNVQPGDDLNYFPLAQAQNLANGLDNSNAAAPGNPNGYHAGYSGLGFLDADFAGSTNHVLVFDCGPHGGCDSGNAPSDRINMPAPMYIQSAESCLRLVEGHELFHHVQYAYITFGNWATWGTMPVEGTARMMQDKIYSDLDANAGCITYRDTVNSLLGSPNQSIWNASYKSALFWNYMAEQYGAPAVEPSPGINFVRRFWENAQANNASPDLVATIRETLHDFDTTATLENVFHDFTITNYTKDLDVSGLDDALRYRYIDENDGVSGSYDAVARAWSGTVPPTKGPTADSVVSWGAKYFEANISTECGNVVGFLGEADVGDAPGWSLVAIKGADHIDRLAKSVGNRFVRAFVNRQADRYTRLGAIVTGFDDAANYNYTFDCGNYKLVINRPTSTYQAYAGLPDEPERFLVRVTVAAEFLGDATVEGLEPTDFQVYVGAEDPANQATVITGDYVSGEYWLVVQAPTKAAVGTYDIRVRLGDIVAARDAAVLYEKRILDEMLVIDRSGSMSLPAGNEKIVAAKSAASLYVDAASADDKVGLVSFSGDLVEPNDDATLNRQLQDVTDPHRANLKTSIAGLVANGWTSIGDGIQKALNEFPIRGSALGEDWIVLLSDGMENEATFWSAVKPNVLAQGVKVHTIALGPLTDQALLQAIANDTGGEYYYVDVSTAAPVAPLSNLTAPLAVGSSALPLRLGDSYTSAMETTYALQRLWETAGVVDTRTTLNYNIELNEFDVRNGRFAVQWANAGTAVSLAIYRPDGSQLVDNVNGVQIYKHATDVVVHVPNMETGVWRMTLIATKSSTEFSATLSGRPYGGTDMKLWFKQRLPDSPYNAGVGRFYPGAPVSVLAVLTDSKGPVRGANVVARIGHPDGSTEGLPLYDDGNHDDGKANDGIYGNWYDKTTNGSPTGMPDSPDYEIRGSYEVVVHATGINNREEKFDRLKKGAFQLFSGDREVDPNTDSDKDGLPDRYERLHWCLNPKVFDSREDQDGDRLSSLEEYVKFGTDPCDADTDDGGETDGSEVNRGANPLDPRDDALPRPFPIEVIEWVPDHMPPVKLLPNTNLVRFPVNKAYSLVRIERGDSPQGPFVRIAEIDPRNVNGLYYDEKLTNGQRYCYRVIGVSRAGGESTPSNVACGTPKDDPYQPIGGVLINRGAVYTTLIDVMLSFHSNDDTVAVRVANTEASLPRATWLNYVPEMKWTLSPDRQGHGQVFAQFRDKFGNISEVYDDSIVVRSAKTLGTVFGKLIVKDPLRLGGTTVQALCPNESRVGDKFVVCPNVPLGFTDDNGSFALSELPPGDYVLKIQRKGYKPLMTDVIPVEPGTSVEAPSAEPEPIDTDGDGVVDFADNCTLVKNTNQRDTNGDGYGNICDPDLNNDAGVNFTDMGILRQRMFSQDADADFNGDGGVNFTDMGILRQYLFKAPGPSGVLQ